MTDISRRGFLKGTPTVIAGAALAVAVAPAALSGNHTKPIKAATPKTRYPFTAMANQKPPSKDTPNIGYRWVDTTTDTAYVCVDNTPPGGQWIRRII